MTIFRPAVISEFQRTKGTAGNVRIQLFRLTTWIVTGLAGAVLVLGNEYNTDSRGEHSLQFVQNMVKNVYENIITGEWQDLSRPSTKSVLPSATGTAPPLSSLPDASLPSSPPAVGVSSAAAAAKELR